MFKELFNVFKNNKVKNDIEIKDNEISKEKVTKYEKTNKVIDSLFKGQSFYYLEMNSEKGKRVKYTQVINNSYDKKALLCLIFTDRDKANDYIDKELKELKKYNVLSKEDSIENILDFINSLKLSNCEGIIINYPEDWAILTF